MATLETLDPSLIVRPRLKKSVLPPASKKRKVEHTVEAIDFDFTAREDYLTGFHKRKLQRAKTARAEAERKDRAERLELRKTVSGGGANIGWREQTHILTHDSYGMRGRRTWRNMCGV